MSPPEQTTRAPAAASEVDGTRPGPARPRRKRHPARPRRKRFFAHHGLTFDKARTFDAEDFGDGLVGFRLAEKK